MDIFKSTLTNSELNFITTVRQHYLFIAKIVVAGCEEALSLNKCTKIVRIAYISKMGTDPYTEIPNSQG